MTEAAHLFPRRWASVLRARTLKRADAGREVVEEAGEVRCPAGREVRRSCFKIRLFYSGAGKVIQLLQRSQLKKKVQKKVH